MGFERTVLQSLGNGRKLAMGELDDGTLFAVNGDEVGWAGRVSDGKRQFVAASVGQPVEAEKIGRMALDGVGLRIAYVAKQGKQWRVVVDGEPGPAHDEVTDLVFSTARGSPTSRAPRSSGGCSSMERAARRTGT